MPKAKAPNLESAATTAAVISRRLKKAGYAMADTSDRYAWTEGFHVSRVGLSNLISVSYHLPSKNFHTADKRMEARGQLAKARAFLAELGYPFNEQGYVPCKRD